MIHIIFCIIGLYMPLCASVIIRDYNAVAMSQQESLHKLLLKFFTDSNSSNTNLFVGTFDQECEGQLLNLPQFTGVQRLAGGNVVAATTIPKSEFPIYTNSCAEVYFYSIDSNLFSPVASTTEFSQRNFTVWSFELTRTSMTFFNDFDHDVDLIWIDEANEGAEQGTLSPGGQYTVNTFIGHTFLARDHNNRNVIDYMVANGRNYVLSPINRIETCDVSEDSDGTFVSKLSCDDMESRLTEFLHRVWYEKRLGLNYLQPQVVHAVTESGFRNRPLPHATYKWLKDWYDKEREKAVFEGSGGPCMNQHVAPAEIAHLPEREKARLADELRPILEDWYGGELYMTSIYGVRKYTNGSILRMHVDTVGTHVVSCIINVDQEVEEDWLLVILDHNDQEHSVRMQPGDMLLYESAKLLHGRPAPFKGLHYDNIFVHYKPYSGWDYDWL